MDELDNSLWHMWIRATRMMKWFCLLISGGMKFFKVHFRVMVINNHDLYSNLFFDFDLNVQSPSPHQMVVCRITVNNLVKAINQITDAHRWSLWSDTALSSIH